MSMPRPKRASRKADSGPSRDSSSSSAKMPKWADAVGAKPDGAFVPYAATQAMPPGAFVSHAKFGKGLVVDAEPGKVTILFEDGTKKLVHGA